MTFVKNTHQRIREARLPTKRQALSAAPRWASFSEEEVGKLVGYRNLLRPPRCVAGVHETLRSAER